MAILARARDDTLNRVERGRLGLNDVHAPVTNTDVIALAAQIANVTTPVDEAVHQQRKQQSEDRAQENGIGHHSAQQHIKPDQPLSF
jgi:hypothetical protein